MSDKWTDLCCRPQKRAVSYSRVDDEVQTQSGVLSVPRVCPNLFRSPGASQKLMMKDGSTGMGSFILSFINRFLL